MCWGEIKDIMGEAMENHVEVGSKDRRPKMCHFGMQTFKALKTPKDTDLPPPTTSKNLDGGPARERELLP